jgi:hypothetical protein
MLVFAMTCLAAVAAAEILPDVPNEVSFPAREARFVRLVIPRSTGGQPCIDELEVYAQGSRENLALASRGGKAAASSCLPGYAIHQIAHLNDGKYGNDFSWIAAGDRDQWAEIELPAPAKVAKVVFSRDRTGHYLDRVPAEIEIRLSLDGKQWTAVENPAILPRLTGFRVTLPPPPPLAPGDGVQGPPAIVADSIADPAAALRYAFLAEEHAWLKTYGRADLDKRLLETPYRQKVYPAHAPDDRLPLAMLSRAPRLSGPADDPCWAGASRGVARVADPYDFQRGPLVEQAVQAGWFGEDLFLAFQFDRVLSSHLALVSTGDGASAGILVLAGRQLLFQRYAADIHRDANGGFTRGVRLEEAAPIDGWIDAGLHHCRCRLPLAWLPDCRAQGIRVGLGLRGKHTEPAGRAVRFAFSPLVVAQVGPAVGRTFTVRVGLPRGAPPAVIRGNVAALADGLTLGPGESRLLTIRAQRGPIGPEFSLRVHQGAQEDFALELFRYDPLEPTLSQTEALLDRLAAKRLDVTAERLRTAAFRGRQAALLAGPPDPGAERAVLLEARLAKRELLLREPDLAPLGKILFEKRHAFEPSHNYSEPFDSRWRPGGGIYLLSIPRCQGRLRPDRAGLARLFDSGQGISRNPVATFDAAKIYFAYRPAEEDYYHLMVMNADGGGRKQLTAGPFHDYFPCPLPDGGLALISTRCRCRYLCWRPQAAVLFRMDAGGENLRPLSFANLTEWGPSVTHDGRILWQRSEYLDKGADYSHTLWAIHTDGTMPELVFGNTILLPQGYANGREVPGTAEVCCTLISHFGDLNGPIALCDTARGRYNPQAIKSLTPEVPWPGFPPLEECFREAVPVARDYFLVSHAPRNEFGLYLIGRYGDRELVYFDPAIGSMCPTLYRRVPVPPVLNGPLDAELARENLGELAVADVYQGIAQAVPRGAVKYLRVAEEVRSNLARLPDGSYQRDHEPFMEYYAAPVDKISGPYGWPSFVAKGSYGIVPVEADGSASFLAPAGKVLYFQLLDARFNEIQRMRSVVQLQPGEKRSCVGCHDDRRHAPVMRPAIALRRPPRRLQPEPWGTGPLSYEAVVQPVFDRRCAACHGPADKQGINLAGTLDADRVPASYKTLIQKGWVHYLDWGYQSGENRKIEPLQFGSVKSKLWPLLDRGHHGVALSASEMRAVKCWIDLNCPLWSDYTFRPTRPGPDPRLTQKN